MESLSISPKLETVIINRLLDMGIQWESITRYTGLYPEEIQSEHSRISPETHYRLLTMLHRECGVDWFLQGEGFDIDYLFNKNNVLDSFSEPSFSLATLCLNSLSLRHALNNYVQYRSLVGNVDRLDFHVDNNGTCRFDYFHYFPELNYSFVTLINFIFIVSLVNNYISDEVVTFNVKCSNCENKMLSNLYKYWNCRVSWSQNTDSITFFTHGLDDKFVCYNESVFDLTLKKVKEEYNKVQDVDSIKSIIEVILKEMINDQCCDFRSSKAIERVCETLHLSKSTLARKLREKNTTYKFVERKVKLEEAIRMLKDTELSIGDISFNLGFSSQSAFNRFFSDLMAITPLKFRKKNNKKLIDN